VRRVLARAAVAAAVATLIPVVAGTVGPAAAAVVTTCGEVVTEDATLAADLHCPSGNGIVVGADDVVVDLMGHTLSGTPTGNGVSATDRGGVVVRDGTVSGFAVGVELQGGAGARIEAVRVEIAAGDETSGIILGGTDDSAVLGNVLVGGGFGVSLLFSADRNRVSGNVAEDVEQGVFVVTSSDNDVSGNQLVRNAAGVVLGQQSNRNVVEGNQLRDGLTGIYVDPDANLDNTVRDNVAVDHDSAGIFLDEGTSRTLVSINTTDRNDVGIVVRAPLTTLTANAANLNNGLGIDAIAGVTDGGGNTAVGNGDVRQCVGVICNAPPPSPPDVVVPVRVTPRFTG